MNQQFATIILCSLVSEPMLKLSDWLTATVADTHTAYIVVFADSVTLAPAAYCVPLALPSAQLLKVWLVFVNPFEQSVKEGFDTFPVFQYLVPVCAAVEPPVLPFPLYDSVIVWLYAAYTVVLAEKAVPDMLLYAIPAAAPDDVAHPRNVQPDNVAGVRLNVGLTTTSFPEL